MTTEQAKRYRLICVAPEIPDLGRYDDLDEAIVNATAHFEVYDAVERKWLGPESQEEVDAAWERLKAKCALGADSRG